MARRIGLHAKIVGGGDDALAKMMQPDAVDQDARGQRIGGVDNREGQFEAAAAVAEGHGVRPGKNLQKSARNNLALVLLLAAQENGRIVRLGAVVQDGGAGGRAGVG